MIKNNPPTEVQNSGVTDGYSATSPNSNQSLDRTLGELKSGRRLEKVIASIESFLFNQVTRIEESLAICQAAVKENEIVQRIILDHETQKEIWEKDRQAEIQRLFEASEKLARGWKQLEEEKQNWLAKQDGTGVRSNARTSDMMDSMKR